MSVENRKENAKHILSVTGQNHLKNLALERGQAVPKKNAWNYNEFVDYLREVIAVLRTRDKQKNVPHEK
jgi:hypothetical protein